MPNASDIPEDSSIAEFMRTLRQHNKVSCVARERESLMVDLTLRSGTRLRVRMTNIYCVGEADVREFLDEDPGLDAVVTLSSWNLVSFDAAAYGRERKKGIFTWKQFFGAINYRKYWLYEEIPFDLDSTELAAERRRRRRAWD